MTRNRESGFALLFIYLLAAAIAILLYIELPRAAFEAQREKELLLIDRGEEYRKAVEKFITYQQKLSGGMQYPKDKDALEKLNNVRFLRRKYIDPITRKDDWRLVKISPDGRLTIEGQEGQLGENPNPFLNNPNATQEMRGAVNPALQQRPSDKTFPSEEGGEAKQGGPSADDPNRPPDPVQVAGGVPSQPGVAPGPGNNAVPPIRLTPQVAALMPGQGSQNPGSSNPNANNPFYNPGAAQQPPGPAANPGGQPGVPQPGVPQPGVPQPGGAPPGSSGFGFQPNVQQRPQNTALGIQNQLTQGRAQQGGAGQTQLGAGVAGVSPKSPMQSIVLYNDKSNYNKWTFAVDQEYLQKKMGRGAGGQSQPGGQGQQGQGQQGGQQGGQGSKTTAPR